MSRRPLRVAVLAFPRRWREVHADEFMATADRLVADGTQRSSALTLVNVVIGGLRLRLRTRPPMHRWMLYRLQWVRLPPTWNDWIRDDLRGRWFVLRVCWFNLWLVAIVWVATIVGLGLPNEPTAIQELLTEILRGHSLGGAVLLVVLVPFSQRMNRTQRRRYCKWMRWEPDGSGPSGSPWGPPVAPQPDRPAT